MSVDYRQRYRLLKKKLKKLIYEHECFQEELKISQQKLLKVSKEKKFLLDELLQHEDIECSDEELNSSSSEQEANKARKSSQITTPTSSKSSKRMYTKKKKLITPKQESAWTPSEHKEEWMSGQSDQRKPTVRSFISLGMPSQRPPDDIFNDDCSDISLAAPSQGDDDDNLIIDMGP